MTGSVKTKSELFNSLKGTEGQYASHSMVILGLIMVMNADINHLIGNEVPEPSVAAVFIKCNVSNFLDEREWDIFTEGIHLCTSKDFIKAFKV